MASEAEYAHELLLAAQAALADVVERHHAPDGVRIGGAVNWADLRVVSARLVCEYMVGMDDSVESWEVLIEEANSDQLQRAVMLGLIERGHPGVNVLTEW